MKKIFNNQMFKNYFLMLLFIMGLEIAFRLISGIKVMDTALIRIFLGANVIAIIIGFLTSLVSKKVGKVIMIILSLVFSIYSFLQLGFNNFIGVYMSFNTTSQLGAVKDYIHEFIASFLGKYYLIFIPFIVLIVLFILIDKFLKMNSDKKFVLKKMYPFSNLLKACVCLLVVLVSGFFYGKSLTASFMQKDLQTVSTESLFNYPSVPSIVVNEFGVVGFGFLDLKGLVTERPEEEIAYYIDDTEEVEVEPLKNRVFDDSIWKELIAKETDAKMNNINNYLINNKITNYNDYSGVFKDKNLIVIMLESVNDIIINKEYYPNFYKMYTEGWHAKNNYSPRNSCATGNNEFSGMTGLYSIYNSCTANVYKDNVYDNAIFNLFNKAGYKTSSMHDYTEAYYFRKTIHRNLGSEKYYGVEDLGIKYYNEYKNWASDEDFITEAMNITLSDTSEPFMLWLTTVSSHQPYVLSSVEGDKYLDLFESTNYPADLKRYMSKLKVVDNALGMLLDRLTEAGILDDTVIVMFGDHYPYGLNTNTLKNVLTNDLDDYEIERVPLVIYNSEIESKEFLEYTSYVNLTPTIANLFGLDYDPRLYMGEDIFSENYLNIVTFADGSWKNDLVYYNASNGTVKYLTDEIVSNDEIKRINNIVTSKMQISTSIIKNNYFNYLNNALSDIKSKKAVLATEIPNEEIEIEPKENEFVR